MRFSYSPVVSLTSNLPKKIMNSSFITKLSKEINSIVVYQVAKYGKREINTSETAKKKLETFLLAMPKNSEEIRDYVLFAKMVGAFRSSKVRKKIKILLSLNDLSDENIKMAKEIFQTESRKELFKFLCIGILPALVGIYLLYSWYDSYIQWWDTIWQILCYVFVFPVLVFLPFYPLMFLLIRPSAFEN